MGHVTLKNLFAKKLRLVLTSLAVVLGVAFMSGTFVLTDTLGSVFDNLFATTRVDNRSMQSLLKSLGFQQTGRPFLGANRAYPLQLWVRCPSLAGS